MKSSRIFSQNKIITFIIILLSSYLINYFIAPVNLQPIEVSIIPIKEIGKIFIVNFTYFHLLLIFSYFGMSFLSIFMFLWNMTSVGVTSGLPLNYYYISSISHGVIELVIYFILFSLSINIIKGYTDKKNYSIIKRETIYFFKYYYLYCIVLLVLGAIAEVIISNRFINLIL